jgi:hypothetical protein
MDWVFCRRVDEGVNRLASTEGGDSSGYLVRVIPLVYWDK